MTIVTEKTIKRIPSAGVSRLSELIIDSDKDWLGNSILNVGNITPQSDNAFDLGSSTKRIRDLYLAKTSGSILFSDGSKIAEDNANLYWNNVNKRLGIGTNTPAYKLDVNGGIRAFGPGDVRYIVFSSGTTGWVGYELRSSGLDGPAGGIFRNNADNNRVSIWSKGQEAISILDTGNVGIGTTTPIAKLDVAGNIRISGGSAPFLKFPDPIVDNIIELWGNNLYTIGIRGGTWLAKTHQLFRFESALGDTGMNVFEVGRTTGETFLSVNSVGNVGIGTTSPGADFDIVRSLPTGNITLRLFNNNTSSLTNNELRIDFSFRDKPAARIATIAKGNWTDALQQKADLAFYTIFNYANFLERMRITSDGNVGIGTTNPATKLDINGNLGIGGVEVITSTRELKNTVVRRLYTADETEVFVTGTTESEVKFHRIVNSSTHGFSIRRVNVIAELKVSGGTGFLKVYIDGVNVITLSTTVTTTYTLVKGSYNVSWADDTIHDVSIRLVNNTSGQTTYNRLYECYVDAI